METIDGAKVAVVIEFAAPPPGPSEQVRSPYGGMMDAPGSLQLMFYVTAPHLGSPTDWSQKGIVVQEEAGPGDWAALQDNITPGGKDDKRVPLTVSASGRTMRIELDLTGQDLLLGKGPFTPTVEVDAWVVTPPTPESISGDLQFFQAQHCLWDTPVSADSPVDSMTAEPAPAPIISSSRSPEKPCGAVDEASAVRQALSSLDPDPSTGAAWDPAPVDSNFDACADLSTVLVMVAGGTGSSPMQALMFHRGEYLGTGTSKAYSFTSLDAAASTDDTVVLTYRSGQSCTACDDGVVAAVRYHWDGNQVQMLDPAPPDS